MKSIRNAYALSSIGINNTYSVKMTAIISNQDPKTGDILVTEGYYINEMGLYAKEADNEKAPEILYSIAVVSDTVGDFMPPYNGFHPVQIIQDYYATVSNSAEITIKADSGAAALASDLEDLAKIVAELQKKTGTGRVRIGARDTQLEGGDTLFVVDGLPETFKAAAFSNVVFSATQPDAAEYWADMAIASGGETSGAADTSIINGGLAVSEGTDVPDGTVFLAKI